MSAANETQGVEVFVSYAHEDKEYRKELDKRLKNLQRRGLIRSWHDGHIGAGSAWQTEILHHLNSAALILLLISPDFVASDFCFNDEMPRALKRHEAREALVIPILLRAVDWEDMPFAELQWLPPGDTPVAESVNQDRAWLDVEKGIRAAVERIPALGQKSGDTSSEPGQTQQDKSSPLPDPPPLNPTWAEWVVQQHPSGADIIEYAAQLCELLAADHVSGLEHRSLEPARLTMDERAALSLDARCRVQAGENVGSDHANDVRFVGRLLYETLVGSAPPPNAAERITALANVTDAPLSLRRLILRATDEKTAAQLTDLATWAIWLRATQTGQLLADQLSPQAPWSWERALPLALQIGEALQAWRKDNIGYLPPTSELVSLSEDAHETP